MYFLGRHSSFFVFSCFPFLGERQLKEGEFGLVKIFTAGTVELAVEVKSPRPRHQHISFNSTFHAACCFGRELNTFFRSVSTTEAWSFYKHIDCGSISELQDF